MSCVVRSLRERKSLSAESKVKAFSVSSFPIRAFDPHDEYSVIERARLPHWVQVGAIAFITWRTWDSMPEPVLKAWLLERNELLWSHGIDPQSCNWKAAARELPVAVRSQLFNLLSIRFEAHLNAGHGACVLKVPRLAEIVSQSLLHFDEVRYLMLDFVVMPNHIHVLTSFPTKEAMLVQCDSWKHFTARQLNRELNRKGRFWQEDHFDHLVRCDAEFQRLRDYIADNPRRAGLRAGEYVHFQKALTI